jgi:mannosylglycoprotein endo-beta-mannosidase
MGANFRGAFKKEKKFLMEELAHLDSKEGAGGLLESEWKERYELEKKMMLAYATEEAYWHKRGGEKWILQGDANTSFFHSLANGRRRRKLIVSLEDGDNVISEIEDLKSHITSFYKNLFGSEPDPVVHLNEDAWQEGHWVSDEDNAFLVKPFSD